PPRGVRPGRLLALYQRVQELLRACRPDAVAAEELFFNRNTTTAMAVGQARGVLLLAAAQQGVPVYEYTPSQVKQAVAGYGKADKHQVQAMVKAILRMDTTPTPDDAADALAVAICHLHSARLGRLGKG
ncbi:MAG: crossover junction endodeoxyribonuclease RuvC, partial [Syntrophomonadaceae bacterium]|nr:crossover junction endodeoxyribonuclease RuvC [Syntrophomonadaceae bacterium]